LEWAADEIRGMGDGNVIREKGKGKGEQEIPD
jgi:hypothetical protein